MDYAPLVRDRAIISLMAYCGLRREECASIRLEAFNWEDNVIIVVGKGNVRRQIPLPNHVAQTVRWYIKTLPGKQKRGKWLFPSKNNKTGHLCTTQINRLLRKTGEMAKVKNPNPKLKGINPHCLRHTYARILKKKGLEINMIAQVMGHKDLRVTQEHYGLPSVFETKRKVLSALNQA
jgi:site-specific recombinase XerD